MLLFLHGVLIYAQLSKSIFHILLTAGPEVVDVASKGWRVSFFLVLGRVDFNPQNFKSNTIGVDLL